MVLHVHLLLFSYQLAKKTEPFILSIIVGNDMVPRMTMRGLAYLKMSIADLIGKCRYTKHQVLCCTGCCGWKPHTPREPDLLKLAPEEANLSSLHSLDLAIDETKPRPALKKIQNSLPFTTTPTTSLPFTLKAKFMKKEKRAVKKNFTKQFLKRLDGLREELKGERLIIESDLDMCEQPMMFIPGRILHIEEGDEYATKRCVNKHFMFHYCIIPAWTTHILLLYVDVQ